MATSTPVETLSVLLCSCYRCFYLENRVGRDTPNALDRTRDSSGLGVRKDWPVVGPPVYPRRPGPQVGLWPVSGPPVSPILFSSGTGPPHPPEDLTESRTKPNEKTGTSKSPPPSLSPFLRLVRSVVGVGSLGESTPRSHTRGSEVPRASKVADGPSPGAPGHVFGPSPVRPVGTRYPSLEARTTTGERQECDDVGP